MSDFISHFSSIPEPRIERCRKHDLLDILFLSISSILCGADGWDFGRARLDWLCLYFSYKEGIPKHDTIAREISRLDTEAL